MNNISIQITDLLRGIKSSVYPPRKFISTVILTGIYFVLFLLLSHIQFSYSLLTSGHFSFAVQELFWLLQIQSGFIGVILTIIYSFSLSILTVTSVSTVQQHSLFANIKGIISIIPGVIVAGCFSCGVGLLGLIGLGTLLTIIPFSGNLIRMIGIIFTLFFISYVERFS